MIRILAPAKVNLTLRVLGRRADGYHDIESLVQKVTLFDRLEIAEADGEDILLTCSDPGLATGPENLVYAAARLLARQYGREKAGLSIRLDKEIPQGAGLGGGSSDAAAVLAGLNTLWRLGLSPEALCEAGARIGSDVPLFLKPSPSVITGRGEKVAPSAVRLDASYVIVFPGFPVSTAWAYSNFRLTKKPDKYTISRPYRDGGEPLPPDRWQDLLVNDLEEAVTTRHPEIGRCKKDLLRWGARASLMSGSGSAVFGLFEDRRTAEQAAVRLAANGYLNVRIAQPIFS